MEQQRAQSLSKTISMLGTAVMRRPVLSVNGILFFSGNVHGVNGPELWKSDGTTAGTVLVKDINDDF